MPNNKEKQTRMQHPMIIVPVHKKNQFSPGSPNDQSMLSRTSRSSTSNSNSSTDVKPDKLHHRKNKVTITSSPFQKYPIYLKQRTKPNGTKPHYVVSKNSHSEHSHSEKEIQHYKDKEKLSLKNKEYAKNLE